MFNSPCRNCPNRHENCHASCQDYQTRKQEYEAEKLKALDQSRQDRETHHRLLREMKRKEKKRR